MPSSVKRVSRAAPSRRLPGEPVTRAVLAALAALWLAGCAGQGGEDRTFRSFRHGFRVQLPPSDPWRRTPDVANILALNDPGNSVLYFDNPYTGGVISLQVLPRHYSAEASFLDEVSFIYRRMLAVPHTDMRVVLEGRFVPLDQAVRLGREKGAERGEFHLLGSMGRRPTARARELERERLELGQPFAGSRTREEVREERQYRAERLTPAYTGHYRGKVVVFLRGGKLYEFYYIDHVQAFEAGQRAFDAFVASVEFLPWGLFARAGAAFRGEGGR